MTTQTLIEEYCDEFDLQLEKIISRIISQIGKWKVINYEVDIIVIIRNLNIIKKTRT